MSKATQLLDIKRKLTVEVAPAHRKPIGIVGTGGIVQRCHLPAYRAIGLSVMGVFDEDIDRATKVAKVHRLARAYRHLDELLADPTVAVVDIAVPPQQQPGIARRAVQSGKHVLCQKPLATDVVEARDLVEEAEAAGVCLAVNQQMRWLENISAAKVLLDLGWIGEPLNISFAVDLKSDFTAWRWLEDSPRLDFLYHSIHYLDAIRWLLGNPREVFATASAPGAKGTR